MTSDPFHDLTKQHEGWWKRIAQDYSRVLKVGRQTDGPEQRSNSGFCMLSNEGA